MSGERRGGSMCISIYIYIYINIYIYICICPKTYRPPNKDHIWGDRAGQFMAIPSPWPQSALFDPDGFGGNGTVENGERQGVHGFY